jgi:hypothetical protein
MTDLSPAAQAVLDAFRSTSHTRKALAATLRAVADQVVPEEVLKLEDGELSLQRFCQRERTRKKILAIATELEGHQ